MPHLIQLVVRESSQIDALSFEDHFGVLVDGVVVVVVICWQLGDGFEHFSRFFWFRLFQLVEDLLDLLFWQLILDTIGLYYERNDG